MNYSKELEMLDAVLKAIVYLKNCDENQMDNMRIILTDLLQLIKGVNNLIFKTDEIAGGYN